MAGDDRKINLDLFARDRTKAGTDSAARNLDKYGKAADESAKRIEKLNHESDLLERELQSLARAFADTEDATERADLSKGIRRLEGDLKKIGKSKGILEALMPDPGTAAKGFVARLGGSLAGSASSLATAAGSSVGPVVGGAIGAAAAPVLVSSLSSALAGGAGLGVLGVGIMAAVKSDTQIQAAGKTAGERFTKGLAAAASGPLRGPILASLDVVSDAGDRLNERLSGVFAELSDDLVPFTRKVVGAGDAVTGSLLKAAKESGPAVDGLGDSVTLLGDGLSSFIDTLADGGPEAAANLRLIAGATGDLIKFTGTNLSILNDLANNPFVSGPLLPELRQHYEEAADATGTFAHRTQGAATATEEQAAAAAAATMSLDEMADSIDKVSNAQRDLYGSEVATKEAILEANEAIRENGAGLDLNTKKGRENRKALDELAGALAKDNAAFQEVNGVSAKTTAHMEGNRAAFIKAARAAGYGADEAKKLADRLLGIPVKTEPRVTLKGAGRAVQDAKRVVSWLNEFQGVYTATMVTNYVRHGKPGTGGGLATGGLVQGPGTSTSDSVPMMLSDGEYVVRASSVARPGVRQMLESLNAGGGMPALAGGGAAGWGGGGGQPLQINLTLDGKVLAQVLMDPQRDLVRRRFGGNVQNAYGT